MFDHLTITQGSNVGGNVPPVSIPADEHPGLHILAIADAVRVERERLNLGDPLAPVTVRVWQVTAAGTYLPNTVQEHTVYPQPADSEN